MDIVIARMQYIKPSEDHASLRCLYLLIVPSHLRTLASNLVCELLVYPAVFDTIGLASCLLYAPRYGLSTL